MKRRLRGHYEPSVAGGIACRGFVPDPLPPTPPLRIDPALQDKLDQAHLALGRLDSLTTLLPDAETFLYSYVRKEAVLSSQIEGTRSSLSDLLLYEEDGAPGVPIDDVAEVSCYVAALDCGRSRMAEGLPLSSRLIRELHDKLMQSGRGAGKAPGQFRKIQNWVGGSTPSSADLVPPPPQFIEPCIAELERFMNDVPERHAPLIKAALAHVQFETIHPFLDGNGRVGRLLIPLQLLSDKVLQEPLLYLSLYFKTHRSRYYELLGEVRRSGEWEAWLTFFADAVRLCAAQAVETARALTALVAADRVRVAGLGRHAPGALLVFAALARRPVRSIPSICAETKQSPTTVDRVLSRLGERLSLVREMTGKRRNRVFAYIAYLDMLNREALFESTSDSKRSTGMARKQGKRGG
jgi:Fic family protein